MKNKLILGSIAGFAVIAAFAAVPFVANAQTAQQQARSGSSVGLHDGSGAGMGAGSGYQASLDARAKAVGMTSAELTEALKSKTMDKIIADKKISTTDYQAKMTEASKARWQAKGLSSEEVQKRVEWQNNRHATATHDGTMQGQGGYGRQNR